MHVQYRWELRLVGATVRYHPCIFVALTLVLESGQGTVFGG
jgi:hypothetical protein